MSSPQRWTDPVTISENGGRIVVETTYDNGDRCQMIFMRDGSAWRITLCHPGMPAIVLPAEHAAALAYALRRGGE